MSAQTKYDLTMKFSFLLPDSEALRDRLAAGLNDFFAKHGADVTVAWAELVMGVWHQAAETHEAPAPPPNLIANINASSAWHRMSDAEEMAMRAQCTQIVHVHLDGGRTVMPDHFDS